MAVKVTRPRIDRRIDKEKDREKCYVCARVENRTAKDVTRAVTFYRLVGDGKDPETVCTVEEVEVVRLRVFPGGNEAYGSVEVCCQIECRRAGDRYLVAMGTVLDANGAVDIDKAEDKKRTPAPN